MNCPNAIRLTPFPVEVANTGMRGADPCNLAVTPSNVNAVMDAIETKVTINVIPRHLSKEFDVVSTLFIKRVYKLFPVLYGH
jgi:hypothetical protein